MDEDRDRTAVQPDRPAQPPAESRRETLERLDVETAAQSSDPSSRRGLSRRLLTTIAISGGIAALLGAALGLVLSLAPTPLEADSAGEAVVVALVLAGAAFLVVSMLAALLLLEREDGRVEREVERRTGREPDQPER